MHSTDSIDARGNVSVGLKGTSDSAAALPRAAEAASGSTPGPNRLGSDLQSLPVRQFIWGAGIECSFLPHLNVDQFNWTQHDRFWREDLRRARDEVGITNLRYAFPWHVLEPQRGKFDWSYADERVAEFQKLGLNVYLDVMHFGTPLWLKQAVGDPEFPESLEQFAEALVTRYRGAIGTFCPFNEPLVSALFSGDFGFWPPHSRKWRGYMPVLSRIVQAVNRGIRAIRRAAPEATVLLCDAAESFKTRHKDLHAEVQRRNLRRFLVMDLLLGRVDANHPLYSWLTSYGLSELDLAWFRSNPQSPDILGLDYYPHSDWQLDLLPGTGDLTGRVRQRRADNPVGLYGVANSYWTRYSIPLMLTETSIEGQAINREIWLEQNVEHVRRLREEGVPMLGLMWWPLIDQVDWDGALTHRIGKVHEVGLINLKRQPDGVLARSPTPLVKAFRTFADAGEQHVGKLESIAYPSPEVEEEQLPPIGEWIQPTATASSAGPAAAHSPAARTGGNGHAGKDHSNGNGDGNGHASSTATAPARGRLAADPVPGLGAEPAAVEAAADAVSNLRVDDGRETNRYGIVVFSHLRWGFVWQRPQQFLSRFARKHPILFIEEPFFSEKEGAEPRVEYHRVMPNVTVVTPHTSPSWAKNPHLPAKLREWTQKAIRDMNEDRGDGAFDRPVLWYYSPMDASWSLGYFENRGVIYDCMDELSQFTGAPKALVTNEARLIEAADVLFTGGYNLGDKKRKQHPNVHTFGCGVEFDHFNKADDPNTLVPPDIDFMARPILGWFGVVDERVDYAMVGEMARMRPDWSFAMVGPVVKVDPNLLPHAPNLYWMGGRDYQQLPNYCRAFDVCMMAFAINAATEFINPTKGLEYMATGRPIVSTPVRDVVKQWSDIVQIARNAEEFIATAQKALERGQEVQNRVGRGIELAKRCSWEGTVKQMQDLIKQAIGRPDRRSGRKIEPMSESQLEYQYMATQGS